MDQTGVLTHIPKAELLSGIEAGQAPTILDVRSQKEYEESMQNLGGAPGRIQTARAERLLAVTAADQGTSSDAMLSDLVKTIPSGRVGTIEDIADAVLFLVSERATYINGAALVVDGSKSVVI